jgi:hypothetical protein
MFTWIKSGISNRVLKKWLREHTTFVCSCKISTQQNGSQRTFRGSIVQCCDNLFDAERIAESIIQKWLDENESTFEVRPDLKWRKGHQLTCATLELECKTVRRLLDGLRKQGDRVNSVIEEVVSESDH